MKSGGKSPAEAGGCRLLKERLPVEAKNAPGRAGYLTENYHYFHLRDTAGQERDFHFHEFDKIVLLIDGRVEYALENVRYELRPWSVLLVKHHTIHRAEIDKSLPYERVIIYLDGKYFERAMPQARLMDCFTTADKTGRHLLLPDAEQQVALRGAIAAYEQAAGDEGFGAQALRDTIIIQLLIQIGRMSASAPDTGARYDPKIQQTLSYINENLNAELTVDTLAERVFLSKYHFMRLFKAQTGSTVHAYIRQKRLLYAARLIREGADVYRAAADSGFGDYSAFHRAFRESFGTSPGKLKR